MAYRVDEQVIRGEIDNRARDRVTGKIWMTGAEHPLTLDLQGNPWRDLVGHRLVFENPSPKGDYPEGLRLEQKGRVGDITASRKVKVPECSMEELMEHYRKKTSFPWHWGNSLYLEWYSEFNGRVVIESSDFTLKVEGEATWHMSEAEERQQMEANLANLHGFMDDMARLMELADQADADEEADAEMPEVEAEAIAEDEKMNLLFDRAEARLQREGLKEDIEAWERIYEEEREKLRREMGEPDPEPLTPEEMEAHEKWIEEMNAICEEAVEEMEQNPPEDPPDHPLVERCRELGLKIHHDIHESGWVPEAASPEHPLLDIGSTVCIAASKLSGAMSHLRRHGDWPPPEWAAGDMLVRLKKARELLKDTLLGLDTAEAQNLGVPQWRAAVRPEVEDILAEVRRLIEEIRDAYQ